MAQRTHQHALALGCAAAGIVGALLRDFATWVVALAGIIACLVTGAAVGYRARRRPSPVPRADVSEVEPDDPAAVASIQRSREQNHHYLAEQLRACGRVRELTPNAPGRRFRVDMRGMYDR